MGPLAIAADDRTGALEVAGACAEGRRPLLVVPFGATAVTPPVPTEGTVVDLASRHAGAAEARRRAVALGGSAGARVAHKLDSALRGNWAVEIDARADVLGRRGVVVAALPALGRVCRRGEVLQRVPGRGLVPIAEAMAADGRGAPVSSRPADHLRRCGVDDVVVLSGVGELGEWLAGGRARMAVCDAGTEADLAAIGAVLATRADVLLAGSAAAIGAWSRQGVGTVEQRSTLAGVATGAPVLVVCGSLHGAARAQLAALRARSPAGVHVLATDDDVARPVAPAAAAAVARSVARQARDLIATLAPSIVVVIGGDTAAAVLGDEPRLVGGTVEPGVPYSVGTDGAGPVVVTRAGSFGDAGALVELIGRLTARRGGGSGAKLRE